MKCLAEDQSESIRKTSSQYDNISRRKSIIQFKQMSSDKELVRRTLKREKSTKEEPQTTTLFRV